MYTIIKIGILTKSILKKKAQNVVFFTHIFNKVYRIMRKIELM